MKMKYLSQPWVTVFANDTDAFIPEIWAAESLMILQNNMVTSSLVHRDFSNEIAAFGDVVNTRKPADFTANRKNDSENVVVQAAVSPNVGVVITSTNCFITSSFCSDDVNSQPNNLARFLTIKSGALFFLS